jgi:oxygen-independent coproporphyrinogen-3 oxidase
LLFGKVREYVDVPDGAEWTFELHPNIIEAPDHAERIDAALECGANRMVFGVQSMDERVLRKLNRGHTGDDVLTLLDLLWSRGVRNVSVDLMFGLPYQTPENWHLTLRTLLDAGVEKFNIFPLMFKQADPISGHRRRSPDIFADGRDRLVMHHMAELMLAEAGFRRGPIFYYSLDPVHSAQQVSKYESIEDVNLLPFGVSGFGFVGQTQFYNHCSLADYIAAAEAGRAPVWVGAELSLDERRRRAVMFSLRSHGVDRLEYEQRYGVDPVDYFAAELVPFVDENLVAVTDDALTLTDRGAPFADSVALRLASDAVKRAVRATNDVIVDPRRDPRDRYDFSPIGRGPIGVGSGEG